MTEQKEVNKVNEQGNEQLTMNSEEDVINN